MFLESKLLQLWWNFIDSYFPCLHHAVQVFVKIRENCSGSVSLKNGFICSTVCRSMTSTLEKSGTSDCCSLFLISSTETSDAASTSLCFYWQSFYVFLVCNTHDANITINGNAFLYIICISAGQNDNIDHVYTVYHCTIYVPDVYLLYT